MLLIFQLGSVIAGDTNKVHTDMGPVAATVARMLEQGHYLHPLSLSEKNPPHLESDPQQTMAERVLKNYLETLDYSHLYLTQGDVDEFRDRFSPTLAPDILQGNLSAPREIFSRFRQRIEDRVAKNKQLAAAPHDFSSANSVQIDRKKAPWPTDLAEADKLWADRIEAELLQERLNKHAINPPAKVVSKRYDQFRRSVLEQGDEDVIKTFLDAMAKSYDPHSDYMSPSEMENFNISMRLSLVGIGAVLRPDDGYARIVEVVPGGPADKDGRLKANDRIAAVAQGKGPYEDVVDMKLDKVVEKIRGAKGSSVRLQVIPANVTDPSKRSVVEITRDEVKLKESEAKGEVIESRDTDGKNTRLGWITLPAFYAEMDRHGQADAKSTTKEVKIIMPDGTETPAKVAFKDADLDLAFIRPEKADGVTFTPVDIANSAPFAMQEDAIILGRLGKDLNREPVVMTSEIISIITKPRTFARVGAPCLGMPIFNSEGKFVGFGINRFSAKGEDSDQGPTSANVVLPAADLIESAAQAK